MGVSSTMGNMCGAPPRGGYDDNNESSPEPQEQGEAMQIHAVTTDGASETLTVFAKENVRTAYCRVTGICALRIAHLNLGGIDISAGTWEDAEVQTEATITVDIKEWSDLEGLHNQSNTRGTLDKKALLELMQTTTGHNWRDSNRPKGVTFGEGDRILRVEMYDAKIKGLITEAFATCSQLQVLYLTQNRLSGRLPKAYSRLSLLTDLSLSHNQLEGELPDEYHLLNELLHLNLGWNRLTGRIPASWGQGLKKLKSLDLSQNRLSGTFVELAALQTLERFSLRGNLFAGNMKDNTEAFQARRQGGAPYCELC